MKEERTFVIAKPLPEDAEGIALVIRDTWLATYVNEERGVTREYIEGRFSNMEKRIARYRQRIEEAKPNVLMLVAKSASRVIGHCVAGTDVYLLGNEVIVLYVLPEFQGYGIGKALMQQALQWFGEKQEVFLKVVVYNARAIQFYQYMGFEHDTSGQYQTTDEVLPDIMMVRKRKL